MTSDFQHCFQQHPGFHLHLGVFIQDGLAPSKFEEHYLPLRQLEGRLYTDSLVAHLPWIPKDHALRREWSIRQTSAKRLATYLSRRKIDGLAEIGCGNGWLLHYLHNSLQVEGVGIDMNAYELEQAARIFGNHGALTFVYADVLSEVFQKPFVDVIILASVIQYFPNLELLLTKLLGLLRPQGEIHILDSPIYPESGAVLAKKRSDDHFVKTGITAMRGLFFHHTWESLQSYNYQILYSPTSLSSKFARLYTPHSPFPWIKISQPDF